jgi:hypothetical protein
MIIARGFDRELESEYPEPRSDFALSPLEGRHC